MVGADGTKIFDFDNPRSLEKALSGKELHRNYFYLLKSTKSTKTTSQKCIFWAPIPHKRYQNTSGFAAACIAQFGFIKH